MVSGIAISACRILPDWGCRPGVLMPDLANHTHMRASQTAELAIRPEVERMRIRAAIPASPTKVYLARCG